MTEVLKTKTCSKCLETKALSDFHKHKMCRGGLNSRCKVCCCTAVKEWYEINRERHALNSTKWREANPGRNAFKTREWYEANKERHALKCKEWRESNKEQNALKKKEWAVANPEKMKAKRVNRMLIPKNKISDSISFGIRRSIKSNKGGRHWETLVDFTLGQLMAHLEGHFDSHMTWENHGTYWHIDHAQPIASFNFKTPEDPEFKQCWALENLQPLEAKQNMSKGAKLDWQPTGETK